MGRGACAAGVVDRRRAGSPNEGSGVQQGRQGLDTELKDERKGRLSLGEVGLARPCTARER